MTYRESAASVLEQETQFTILDWFTRVNQIPDIISVPLSMEERCAHLPEMFHDIARRLRDPLPLGTRALMSDAAHNHGQKRRVQGYTAPMLVEESRILQVSIFETLQLNLRGMDTGVLLGDVMTIADEVDSQLAQTMSSYLYESAEDNLPAEPQPAIAGSQERIAHQV